MKIMSCELAGFNYDRDIFTFTRNSPLIVSGKLGEKKETYNSNELAEVQKYMRESILKKAKLARYELGDFKINIQHEYRPHDIKYEGMNIKGRVMKIKIDSNEETKKFILNNGIGKKCGMGFGMLL